MKHLLFAAALAAVAVPAVASNIGGSISIGQPGFYGPPTSAAIRRRK
ncbi:MAG: hypothetical protein ACSLEZ_05850 [Thiobacillus sp.]